MISVMMSSGSNNGFASDRSNLGVERDSSGEQEKVSTEDEDLSSSSKCSKSGDFEGKEVPRVSTRDENAAPVVGNVSGDKARVSSEENGYKDSDMKNEDSSSEDGEGGKLSGEKAVVEVVESDDSYTKGQRKKTNVSSADYDSMLSMFDDYAGSGKNHRVGHGYEVGDMVWGKVKSHPWWPGHIFSEAFATTSVRKTKREGHVLVAFFGDSSYGWFDPAELIPFELNFAEKSRQTNSRTFVKAVEDAMDELNRRRGLGLACRCRNPFSFRPTNVDGFLAVDFSDSDTGVFSVSQIKRARDGFVPGGMLNFLKDLALKPMDNEHGSLHFIQNKATVLAFRKAVYEEFDETYAQAFGAQPARSAPAKAPPEPSRAPLSGRLVFAEALGKGKSSGKLSKLKDQSEKDKYLFKRRDESADAKSPKISHGQSSTFSQSSQTDVSDISVRGSHPVVVTPTSHSTLPSIVEVSADQIDANETIHDNLSVKHRAGVAGKKLSGEFKKVKIDGEFKKAKVRKRPLDDVDSENSVKKEKIKKRKKDMVKEKESGRADILSADDNSETLMGKIGEKSSVPQVYPVRENLQVNQEGNDVVRPLILPDAETKPVKDVRVELPQLLGDLRALALNPFHGAPADVWKVFMSFRSLVYLKSPSNESKEARPSTLFSHGSSSDNNIREKTKVKQPRPPARVEDPTKGGVKRAPSDRLEEMAVRKKKKFNDVKSLAAERRAALKESEASKADGRDTAGKVIAQTAERKASQKTSGIQRADGKEGARKSTAQIPSRVAGSEPGKKKELQAKAVSPTLLIMKFPAEASLPSSAELKAKFARFGRMDYKATRIFYTTHTIRLVYHRISDAQAALNFANSNFGNINVRCFLREREVETPEAEPTTVQTEDQRDLTFIDTRPASNAAAQPLQPNTLLKSCLKRPFSEDGITATGGGNGNGRGRVKFILGGEGNSRTTNADEAASSHGLNNSTEKFQMVAPPPSSSSTPVPSTQFPFAPSNFPQTEIQPRNTGNQPAFACGPPSIDIRQEMISLLCRCEAILKTLEGALGYVPYHL